jgi:NitT/TauT family transport system substrate-binding protein
MTTGGKLMITRRSFACAAGLVLAATAAPALAQDQVKVAIGQRGLWDTAICHLGDKAGIFGKHGIKLELLYTAGAGETQQAVISNSVDIGMATGVYGSMGAFSKGAPIRIIGAQATGAAEFWYVKSGSSIKTLKDAVGKTMAYSTNGSSTHSMALALIREAGVAAKPVATGNPPSTLTAVMTDQVDIGWASPPFGFKEMDAGQIRIVAKAAESKIVTDQTIRVIVTQPDTLAKRKDMVQRFMDAYRDTIDYMYSDNPQVMKDYAEFVGVSETLAKRVRNEFFPKSLLNPDEIKGLEMIVPDAVALKYIAQPLTADQLKQLIQIPPRRKS